MDQSKVMLEFRGTEVAVLRLQLEMILQAQEYEGQQDMKLDEFFESTKGKWHTDLGRQWAAEVISRRGA